MTDAFSKLNNTDLQTLIGGLRSQRITAPYSDLQVSRVVSSSLADDPSFRLSAIKSLLYMAERPPSWRNGPIAASPEVQSVIDSLLGSLQCEQQDVRLLAVRALGVLVPSRPGQIATAMDQMLQDPMTEVVSEALVTLSKCDESDYAAAAVNGLVAALELESAEKLTESTWLEEARVRRGAAQRLGEIGLGAARKDVLMALVKRATNGSDRDLQRKAVWALSSIFPESDHVAHVVGGSVQQGTILAVGAELGSEIASWRAALQARWTATTPPDGYCRMKMNEIVDFIYGTVERPSEPGKNVRNWMDNLRIRAFNVDHGWYDVLVDDLSVQRSRIQSSISHREDDARPGACRQEESGHQVGTSSERTRNPMANGRLV